MTLTVDIESWPLRDPFRITGHEWTAIDVVVATWRGEDGLGRGEAQGVYYHGETALGLKAQIEGADLDDPKLSRQDLLNLLPAGGARNAVDCALWERDAQRHGLPAWRLAGLNTPRPLLTTMTIGVDAPDVMAAKAIAYVGARALKLKLNGDGGDAERVSAVRAARADVWLGVDANQGFTPAALEALLPTLVATDVKLIEQPFPIGQDDLVDGYDGGIPLAADESFQDLDDLEGLLGRYDVANIKLDKCGGLTRGLQIAAVARELGLQVMVGNMLGTSLAMAPAYLLGQHCDVVDLDGPIPLLSDRTPPVVYEDGHIRCDEAVWASGSAEARA